VRATISLAAPADACSPPLGVVVDDRYERTGRFADLSAHKADAVDRAFG
jgi:hypothetical protein